MLQWYNHKMPPPLIGGGVKQWCCVTSICLSVAYIGPKSRTERPRKTKIGTWLGHHFQGQKVKGQGHQAALLTAAFTHEAAAAVTVGTYLLWEPTATLQSGAVGSAARGASVPTEGGEGREHIVAAPAQLVLHWTAHFRGQVNKTETRPRPKFWPWGQSGLASLISLVLNQTSTSVVVIYPLYTSLIDIRNMRPC